MTRRERIIELLSTTPSTINEISEKLEIDTKIIAEDLIHIQKSLKRSEKRLEMIPPRCVSCGYQFPGRSRPTTPSRCSKCKSERIENPIFRII